MATCRDIAASEVGNNVNARKFSQQCRIVELHRVPGAIKLLRSVANRLPMGSDCGYLAGRHSACHEQILHNARVYLDECIGCQGRPVNFILT